MNFMNLRIGTLFFAAILFAPLARGQSKEFHDPADIFKIMEESSISYGIHIDDGVEPVIDTPMQLMSGYVQRTEDDGSSSLETNEVSEENFAVFTKAEEHFTNSQYDSAIVEYRRLLKRQPDYTMAWTMIGDAFYNLKKYDSARFYLKKSIGINYIDYQAHWFLSSVEFQSGNDSVGLQELTIAHVLNPGHTMLASILKTTRKKFGRDWDDWTFTPHYNIIDESIEEVTVNAAPGWMLYALVKALWLYEPGYAAEMGVDDAEELDGEILSEKESALMFLYEALARKDHAGEEGFDDAPEADAIADRLIEIVQEGFIDPFIYYEIIGKKNPIVFSLMNQESIEGIARYVNAFH